MGEGQNPSRSYYLAGWQENCVAGRGIVTNCLFFRFFFNSSLSLFAEINNHEGFISHYLKIDKRKKNLEVMEIENDFNLLTPKCD